MELRRLGRDEVELLWLIDRSEAAEHVYRVRDGQLVREPSRLDIPGWSLELVADETPRLYECFDFGGTFLALFDGDAAVAVAIVEARRVGRRRDQLPLAYLYVSRTYRRRGLGTRLFEEAVALARADGADALYVSSTPTENTVDFYLRRGCILAPDPDPGLLAAEPEDIQLLFALR